MIMIIITLIIIIIIITITITIIIIIVVAVTITVIVVVVIMSWQNDEYVFVELEYTDTLLSLCCLPESVGEYVSIGNVPSDAFTAERNQTKSCEHQHCNTTICCTSLPAQSLTIIVGEHRRHATQMTVFRSLLNFIGSCLTSKQDHMMQPTAIELQGCFIHRSL